MDWWIEYNVGEKVANWDRREVIIVEMERTSHIHLHQLSSRNFEQPFILLGRSRYKISALESKRNYFEPIEFVTGRGIVEADDILKQLLEYLGFKGKLTRRETKGSLHFHQMWIFERDDCHNFYIILYK